MEAQYFCNHTLSDDIYLEKMSHHLHLTPHSEKSTSDRLHELIVERRVMYLLKYNKIVNLKGYNSFSNVTKTNKCKHIDRCH